MTFYLVLNSKFKLHNKITVYRIDLHTKNVCVCVCVWPWELGQFYSFISYTLKLNLSHHNHEMDGF